MAVKTFMVASGNDGNFGALVDGVDQAAASRVDGWTVAKLGSGQSSEFDAGTKQISTSFSAEAITTKPASFLTGTTANAFKTPAPLTGTFAGTIWLLLIAVRATVAASQAGRTRIRIFKSVNASGASATELTSGAQVGFATGALSTTADQDVDNNWNLGSTVTVNNEYLFFVLAWETTTAGGNNSADVVIRTGQASTGSRFITPDLAAAAAAGIPDVGMALTVT